MQILSLSHMMIIMRLLLDTWASLEILPKHILENEDINSTFFSRKPVGSNYYKLGDWVSGQQVNLIKSENGVLGAAYIEKLTSRIIPDTSSQFLELSAGNIDLNEYQSNTV
jgi:peptide/nickel transport system substrate-binding protein